MNTTTLEIADKLGRERIADAVGVGLTAVSNAVVRGHFPATWFLAVKALCDTEGHPCPPRLFRMKGDNSQDVDTGSVCQGGDAK